MTIDIVLAERLAPLLPAFPVEDLGLVIEMAVLIAHADAVIDTAEHAALRTAMETALRSRLSTMVVNTLVGSAVDNFRAVGKDAYATQLGRELARRKAGTHGFQVALVIALSSEGISAEERRYIVGLGEAAGLSTALMRELEAEVRGMLDES